eukprot:gnl/MRDRNA2_/MRDRNA2_61131_c0_seq1.p1 gnl/MRDRNA2_/MRDRNA2_61131_c0~~gnl/MRDRNA2_/MRDRNA2_61131_c0_seq1.p1  ORF type:complete len:1272 (+),score=188.22 gnl/MRDRNA2_/MRDRNA2_61131_c0_seq1:154-3969(+)
MSAEYCGPPCSSHETPPLPPHVPANVPLPPSSPDISFFSTDKRKVPQSQETPVTLRSDNPFPEVLRSVAANPASLKEEMEGPLQDEVVRIAHKGQFSKEREELESSKLGNTCQTPTLDGESGLREEVREVHADVLKVGAEVSEVRKMLEAFVNMSGISPRFSEGGSSPKLLPNSGLTPSVTFSGHGQRYVKLSAYSSHGSAPEITDSQNSKGFRKVASDTSATRTGKGERFQKVGSEGFTGSAGIDFRSVKDPKGHQLERINALPTGRTPSSSSEKEQKSSRSMKKVASVHFDESSKLSLSSSPRPGKQEDYKITQGSLSSSSGSETKINRVMTAVSNVRQKTRPITEDCTRRPTQTSGQNTHWFMLSPEGSLRVVWDCISLVLTVWLGACVPMELSFGWQFEVIYSWWESFDRFQDVFFMCDIVLNFRTGFYEQDFLTKSQEAIVLEPWRCAKEYLFGWFLADAVASVPWNELFVLMGLFSQDKQSGKGWLLLRSVRVLKVLRLLRILRILNRLWVRQIFNEVEESLLMGEKMIMVFEMCRLMSLMAIASHFVACIWFAVPMYWYCGGSNMPVLDQCEEQTWFLIHEGSVNITTARLSQRYLISMHSALLLLLGESVPVVSLPETVTACILLLIGVSFLTVFQAKLTAVATQWGARRQDLRKKLLESLQYLRTTGIGRPLQNKVRMYIDFIAEKEMKMGVSPAVLAMLSAPLRSEVVGQSLSPILRKCSLLVNCPDDFLRHLAIMCDTQHAGAEDRIVEQGTIADAAFFLIAGVTRMLIRLETGKKLDKKSSVTDGTFTLVQDRSWTFDESETDCIQNEETRPDEVQIGEIRALAVFGEQGLIRDGVTHECTVECRTQTQFVVLTKESLQITMAKYPKIASVLRKTWLKPELVDVLDLRCVSFGEDSFEIPGNNESQPMRPLRSEMEAQKLVLWQGDITQLRVDAIVNPTNIQLLPGSGINGAIHAAAGPNLKEACRLLEGCFPGDAKATPAFDLAGADLIFHTVGPQGEDSAVLRSCYLSCLQLAEENQCKTIAFCPISADHHGYGKSLEAELAVQTVARWLSGGGQVTQKSLVFKRASTFSSSQSFASRLFSGSKASFQSSSRTSTRESTSNVSQSIASSASYISTTSTCVHFSKNELKDRQSRHGSFSPEKSCSSINEESEQEEGGQEVLRQVPSSPQYGTSCVQRVVFVVTDVNERGLYAAAMEKYFTGTSSQRDSKGKIRQSRFTSPKNVPKKMTGLKKNERMPIVRKLKTIMSKTLDSQSSRDF